VYKIELLSLYRLPLLMCVRFNLATILLFRRLKKNSLEILPTYNFETTYKVLDLRFMWVLYILEPCM